MFEERDGGSNDTIQRAMRAEAEAYLSRAQIDDLTNDKHKPREVYHKWLDSLMCAMMLAAIGAAARYASEHHDDDPEVQHLIGEAALVVAAVPPRLHRLWTMYYVEGQSLAAYAESTGVDASTAQADYFEIIRTVVRLMNARYAEKMTDLAREHAPAPQSRPAAAFSSNSVARRI
jgi:hypothetical protein